MAALGSMKFCAACWCNCVFQRLVCSTDNWQRVANLASGGCSVRVDNDASALNSAVKRQLVRFEFVALTKIAALNYLTCGEYYTIYIYKIYNMCCHFMCSHLLLATKLYVWSVNLYN